MVTAGGRAQGAVVLLGSVGAGVVVATVVDVVEGVDDVGAVDELDAPSLDDVVSPAVVSVDPVPAVVVVAREVGVGRAAVA